MIPTSVHRFRILNNITDAFVFLLAFILGCITRWRVDILGNPFWELFRLDSLTALFLLFYVANFFSLLAHCVYPTSRLRSFGSMAIAYFESVFSALAAIIVIAFFFQDLTTSRLLLATSSAYCFVFLLIKEHLIRKVLAHLRLHGYNLRNAIIVGHDREMIIQTAWEIANNPLLGLKLVGVIVPKKARVPSSIEGVQILGSLDELIKNVEEHDVDHVIFTSYEAHEKEIEEVMWRCEKRGIEIWLKLDLLDRQISQAAVERLNGVPFLTFRTGPQDSWLLIVKGILDKIMAFILLVVSSPAFLILAVLIKTTSPGPVIFKQYRAGRRGQKFVFYKFRSMIDNAEQYKESLSAKNEMKGPVFKIKEDPRITPIGKFLRRTSLDEIPQFWNVLRGDMSIVGPRPLPILEVKEFKGWQRRRLSMKPGITCLWQVSGRNTISDFDEWTNLDLQYVDNWSLWLDLKILLKTIPAVLFTKGAR